MLLLPALVLNTSPVGATSQNGLFQQGIYYFDLAGDNNAGSCGTDSVTLTGSDNAGKVFNFFVTTMGYTPQQAAGAVGSMTLESHLNPKATNGSSGAYGIAQWLGGRLDNLKKIEGGNYDTLEGQVDFIKHELNGDYTSSVNTPMKQATTYQDAQKTWTWYYEGLKDYPDQWFFDQRNGYASDAFTRYGGGVPASGASTSSSSCAFLSPDCTNAQGVAKILCAAKAYDPVSYQMGAGHSGAAAWHKSCPAVGPSCYLDCSGLVNIAVYDAFGAEINEDTSGERADIGKYWKRVSLHELQPGDIVQPESDHVEIVDHVVGSKVYAFAAHTDGIAQPQQVGEWTDSPDIDGPGSLYLHYIGPGV